MAALETRTIGLWRRPNIIDPDDEGITATQRQWQVAGVLAVRTLLSGIGAETRPLTPEAFSGAQSITQAAARATQRLGRTVAIDEIVAVTDDGHQLGGMIKGLTLGAEMMDEQVEGIIHALAPGDPQGWRIDSVVARAEMGALYVPLEPDQVHKAAAMTALGLGPSPFPRLGSV